MSKMKLKAIVMAMLLLALGPSVSSGQSETAKGSSGKEQIVVHTPLQNYEQPSLRDYDECQSNRQSCLDICAGSEQCDSECPRCPELVEAPLLVQGINDTNYVAPPQKPLNTTNIIRLTNEINNIINNDILSRNEINVKVHQNVSQLGGRFGLGYSEQGSCCYVVRRQRDCEDKEHCREASRQRVCGTRCQARVMIAKRVVQCDKDKPEDCHETLEYVPARKRKQAANSRKQSDLCRFSNGWSYVNCVGQEGQAGGRRVRRGNCQSCLDLSYGYILQHGLPPQCFGCLQGYGVPMMPMTLPMAMYYPTYPYMPNFGYNNQQLAKDDDPKIEDIEILDDDESGWTLKSQKCLDDKGQLVDCVEGSGDFEAAPPAHLETGAGKKEQKEQEKQENNKDKDKDTDTDKDKDIDDDYKVPIQRRRRRQSHHQFIRSSYSRRRND